MRANGQSSLHVTPAYEGVIRSIGMTARGIFDDPRIVVWRSVTERQNCTLDVVRDDGRRVRLHVKRYLPTSGRVSPAEEEWAGIRALEVAQIPTVPLVAWGRLSDRRSFIVTEDLAGYRPADKLLAEGVDFESLLGPTAAMAAALHGAGLHHRDLYLCHFFVRTDGDGPALRLIDAARVRRLPRFLTRRRWVVKDLGQFWYSTLSLPIGDDQRARWLERYGAERGGGGAGSGLRRAIERKARSIARHDAKLRVSQPRRNVSLG